MCMSSELGLPHPLSRKRVCPNQRAGWGAHSPAGEEVLRRLENAWHSAYSVHGAIPERDIVTRFLTFFIDHLRPGLL
jgi:hypothetical protein